MQIVTQFETVVLEGKTKGSVNVQINQVNGEQPTELIAFLQNNKTGNITAATSLSNLIELELSRKSER